MEATELFILMLCICVFGALLYGRVSPLRRFTLSPFDCSVLMGIAVASTMFMIIRSPFGRRSGAHFNPAITLTYFWLGRIHRWDAMSYVASQFAGAIAGVFTAHAILGSRLSGSPVSYVVTLPGNHGYLLAFVAEFLTSGLLMGLVLFATNHRRLARFSPILFAGLTVFYYMFGSPISGFSVNPARSFSSAFFAWIWNGMWIYFVAPSLGMLAAAAVYIRRNGPGGVYCAKVFHDRYSPCPFSCRFQDLVDEY
jgi:aquaporin Z